MMITVEARVNERENVHELTERISEFVSRLFISSVGRGGGRR